VNFLEQHVQSIIQTIYQGLLSNCEALSRTYGNSLCGYAKRQPLTKPSSYLACLQPSSHVWI
jgi:hypothetical protein